MLALEFMFFFLNELSVLSRGRLNEQEIKGWTILINFCGGMKKNLEHVPAYFIHT